MRRMSNMLMAGAAGRNLGKTEFLCRAIREQSKTVPVIGIKITTIDDTLADYRNIEGDFLVSIEKPADDNKDTHRMFRSGASQVFWLRVKRPHLNRGLAELFQTMEAEGVDITSDCLVMESGGARKFIEPGLFFIIREHNDEMKPAVADVAHLADCLNTVNGEGWDVLPEDLVFANERWGRKEKAAAIILSGGKSSRMGEDKARMQLEDRPLLSSVVTQLLPNFERVLVSGSPEKYAFSKCDVVEDLEPDCGPLMGLFSTLQQSVAELNFITTCDIPEIHLPFVRTMIREIGAHDAVVPILGNGKKQPLFAVYKKTVAPTIGKLLEDGKRAVHALLDEIDVQYISLDADWYHNLNTHDDVERYKETLE